jgi:integrase
MARTKDLRLTRDRRRTAKYGRGKRWLAQWDGPDGTEHTKAFATQVDAKRYGSAMEADQLRGVYVNPRRGAQLVRDYGEGKFLPSLLHLRPNSAATYASHLRTHVWPLLGDRRIGSLEKTDIKSFVSAKSRELAPSTIETVLAVLRAMMTAAVEDKVIVVNPCSRVPLPEVTPRVLVPIAPEAVLTLLDRVPARYRVGVALGAAAGLRFGEATGLTAPRVEHLRRRIQVLEQAQNGALAPLKTKASRRTVTAGDWLLDEIALHLERFGTGPEQVIMTNAGGRIIARNAFGDMWRKSVAAARICGKRPAAAPAVPECRETCADPQHMLAADTRFHDLRHFYASTLIAANLNPKVIQARLGHATMAETMDTYGHLFPDSEDLGRQAIDSALAEQQRNRTAQ